MKWPVLRKFNIFIAFGLIFPASMEACSVCFYGNPDDPANIALKWSITCLLLILFAVLGLLAKFFLSVRKRAKLMEIS